ncbi:hypothetical protein ACS0TY_017911 [Phlomoides rotata]
MNFTHLRTLKLNGASVKELPSSIGKLKHLRHLDFLCNLQILILNKCRDLKCLAWNIRYMTNLHHIFF